MNTKRATIKDIAQRAGVSTATVSRILNQRSSTIPISESTREAVLAAARELHYVPNQLARSLRSGSPGMVGVIVPDASNPFVASVIAELDNALEEHGYHFLLTQARSGEAARKLLTVLEKYGIRNVLLMADLLDDEFLNDYVPRLHGHVVGLGRAPSASGLITVCVDNKRGIDLAIDHLIKLGHRRIAFVGGGTDSWDMRQRREAYEQWVNNGAITYSPGYIQPVSYGHLDVVAGAEAMERLLSLSDPPTAVVFGNDPTAIGGINTAQNKGLSVPEDIAVIGFDDITWAKYCTPPLTTVRQPVQAMVAKVATLLKKMLEGTDVDQDNLPLVFPPELVIRASCGAFNHSSHRMRE